MQLYTGVWFNTCYQVKKQIIIDHTKVVGGADLSNYPLLVSFIDPNLVIPSGFVQNVNGFDIIFVSADETTQLNHEIENYNASTGEIEMYVLIPTLDRKSTRLNSSHQIISYAVFCLKKKNIRRLYDTNH